MIKLKQTRIAVQMTLKPNEAAYTLDMKYPYTYDIDSLAGTVNVEFRDLPERPGESFGEGDMFVTPADLALRYMGYAHSCYFKDLEMIPMPSLAKEGESYAPVPEHVALIILQRNWEIAKTYMHAKNEFTQEQRRAIRKAANGPEINVAASVIQQHVEQESA